jgi:epoxyqueuosine reductase
MKSKSKGGFYMNNHELTKNIKEKALSLGFESCGIVGTDALAEYEGRLDERIADCPASKPMLEALRKYARPQENYDWAKSVIVCVTSYAKYRVPECFDGLIGKYYLFDHKLQPDAVMNRNIIAFETYLSDQGIRAVKELHGVTSGRLAAAKAGLGIIGKNNFFYSSASGSRVIIDTWIIDRELELVETADFASSCPEGCRKCIDSCPTKALSKPYCTDASSCITKLTWGISDLPPQEIRSQMKTWIYGCDECQDACPMNLDIRDEGLRGSGLEKLAENFSLEHVFRMQEDEMKASFVPKFWFIRPENLWIWKVNALRAMANSFKEEYGRIFIKARSDENEKVRAMADWAISRLDSNAI